MAALAAVGVVLLGTTLALPAVAGANGSGSGPAGTNVGSVYTQTNAASGNAVMVFDRSADGRLTWSATYPTGGLGTGSGLGSENSVVLSDDGSLLLVVNGGSNEVSVFHVARDGLTLADVAGSGGIMPVSLTLSGNLVYVVNAGGAGNIAGFWIDASGMLTPIPGSTQPLSGAGAAQISFDPAAPVLVVTEKATSTIDTFTVDANGVASGPMPHASNGATPFGFAFDNKGHLIVSEVGGGPAGTAALSSYAVGADGSLTLISGSVPDYQYAACWVVTTNNGRFAYTSNAHPPSNDLSSYSVGPDGTLNVIDEVAAKPGNGPTDLALSRNSRFLYVLNSADRSIAGFAVNPDGSLVWLSTTTGMPGSVVGLAAM